jgi:hypothetical protein
MDSLEYAIGENRNSMSIYPRLQCNSVLYNILGCIYVLRYDVSCNLHITVSKSAKKGFSNLGAICCMSVI